MGSQDAGLESLERYRVTCFRYVTITREIRRTDIERIKCEYEIGDAEWLQLCGAPPHSYTLYRAKNAFAIRMLFHCFLHRLYCFPRGRYLCPRAQSEGEYYESRGYTRFHIYGTIVSLAETVRDIYSAGELYVVTRGCGRRSMLPSWVELRYIPPRIKCLGIIFMCILHRPTYSTVCLVKSQDPNAIFSNISRD